MRYLLLFNKDEARYRALSPEERAAIRERYERYGVELFEAGVMVAGSALEPSTTATTVRVRGGKRTLTDGPFVETDEQIAGFALIDVPDLDEALRWAARHPDAEMASVEVRPAHDWTPPSKS